jgi:transcription termination/antitermination protein NusG
MTHRGPGTDTAGACPLWFALRVRSNAERAVRHALRAYGIEEFLPLVRTVSQWSDRVKTIERPLFPGYLFARVDPRNASLVAWIPGVVSFLPSNLEPIPVDAAEIESIRLLCSSMLPLQVSDSSESFDVGETVTIERGALSGLRGVVTHAKGRRRLVVAVEMLHRTVSVELPAESLSNGPKAA